MISLLNGTDPNLDPFAVDLSYPSGPKHLGGRLVDTADTSTQFPTAVDSEDLRT